MTRVAEDRAARSIGQRGAANAQCVEDHGAVRGRRRHGRSASCTSTICCAPASPKANMSDHRTTIQTALAARFGEECFARSRVFPASKSLPKSPATAPSAAISISRSRPNCSGSSAPARCRRPRRATCSNATSSSCATTRRAVASRTSFRSAPHRQSTGISRHPRQWPPAQAYRADARETVPERSPRPVLQCRGRCRHRACDLPARRRRGRARLLSDQRDPRSRCRGERPPRLPERVIPVCGLCVGWPSENGHISPRLGLDCTLHVDRYEDNELASRIDAYDRRRAAVHGYRPRDPARWQEASSNTSCST